MQTQPDFAAIQVGDALPPLTLPPVDRTTLALYAGASNDHNPIHIDIDYAQRAGLPDVFAHGMLSMAWLGRLLTQWVDQRQLRGFGVRFASITHLGDRITCSGKVVEKFEAGGEQRVRLEIRTANQDGETKVVGDAVVAL
jgi:acyl dehydratase